MPTIHVRNFILRLAFWANNLITNNPDKKSSGFQRDLKALKVSSLIKSSTMSGGHVNLDVSVITISDVLSVTNFFERLYSIQKTNLIRLISQFILV